MYEYMIDEWRKEGSNDRLINDCWMDDWMNSVMTESITELVTE
jgi:hypothetical protein